MVDFVIGAGFCVGLLILGADMLLARWLKGLQTQLKREQLRDQIFRDACDTIHVLRVENDALTAMLMAKQGH